MQNHKKRILIFSEGVTLAHVGRPLVIAEELIKMGHEVHFAVDARFLKFTKNIKAEIYSINSLASEIFLTRVSSGKPLFTFPELSQSVEEDLQLIDRVKPDIIISDLRWSITVSARLRKIPLITITNSYWSPYGRQKFILPDHPILGFLGQKTMQTIFSLVRPFAFSSLNKPLNKLRKKYGLQPIGKDYLKSHTDGEIVLYADMQEMHPVYNAPDNHHYIGAITWSPAIEFPAWWENLPSDKPIVYVSLGSSGAVKILPKILAALETLPVTIITTTAGRAEGIVPPANCFIADYLSGDACAARASLFITNGGSPSSYQAICAGVPVLGIASLMDQHLFMQGVVKAGAGELLCSPQVTINNINSIVQKMLKEESYTKSAQILAEKSKKYNLTEILSPII